MEVARKITGKMLLSGLSSEAITKGCFVGRLYGTVKGSETVTTTFGDSVRFTGEFIAIRHTGEEVVAPECFVPRIAEMILLKGLSDNPQGFKFGFDIYTEPNRDPGKHNWVVKPLMEIAGLESIRVVAAQFPALPAPGAVPAPSGSAEPGRLEHASKDHANPSNPSKKKGGH